ncbi:hypothetical protein L6452_15924 [Arctium lappa]|uniref:Uncharacterized protein n=1 Tax=Arctium lappa TaxID=4217 RepID=A0ACB9CQ87_ARCLA|nr:hypothetical protein L6452_15924 [Arctium lappa]
MNLQSISNVMLKDGVDNLQKCFPSIKKLTLHCDKDNECHFELLPYLETLKLTGMSLRHNQISFPATLKKLTLVDCFLPWSNMSIIHPLPNLEVLKLKSNAFMGRQWDACEQQFRQLKLLTLESLNIKHWEASSTSFPCLKQLSLLNCDDLEEIPLEIGEIATLELIETDSWNDSVVESVKRIQQEQHDVGNYDLKINVDGMDLSFYLSLSEGSKSKRLLAKLLSRHKKQLML